MEISNKMYKDVSIVLVDGDFVSRSASECGDYLLRLAEKSHVKAIVLNLENAKFIDSYGIAVIMNVYKTMLEEHKPFTICCVREKISNLLKMLYLDGKFKVCKTQDDALSYVFVAIDQANF